jgi:hypothetical protein
MQARYAEAQHDRKMHKAQREESRAALEKYQ